MSLARLVTRETLTPGSCDVVGEIGDARDFDARFEFDLVASDGGTRHDLGQPGVYPVLAERVLEIEGGLLEDPSGLRLATATLE
jgi:hypothetical protein